MGCKVVLIILDHIGGYGKHCIMFDGNRLYWVLLGLVGLYLIVLGPIGCIGSYWVVTDLIWSCWFRSDFIGWYNK